MSGALIMAQSISPQPLLFDRSLTSSGTFSAGTNYIRVTFGPTLLTRESGVSTDRSPEWLNGASADNYEVRCTIVSGDVEMDPEFSSPDVWYAGGQAFWSELFPSGITSTLTGVWRFDVREISTGVIRASALYNMSTTCSDCG